MPFQPTPPDPRTRTASRTATGRSACSFHRRRFRPCRCEVNPTLEVTLAFFEFHGAVLIVVDDAELALRVLRYHELLDDLLHGVGVGLDRASARRAAERTHPALDHLRLLARQERDEWLLLHDQRVA